MQNEVLFLNALLQVFDRLCSFSRFESLLKYSSTSKKMVDSKVILSASDKNSLKA